VPSDLLVNTPYSAEYGTSSIHSSEWSVPCQLNQGGDDEMKAAVSYRFCCLSPSGDGAYSSSHSITLYVAISFGVVTSVR